MKIQTELVAGRGASVKGLLKLIGLFSLIIAFTPVHLALVATKRADPAAMPRLFHKTLSKLLGFRIRVHGIPAAMEKGKETPVFFVSNHSSYLDIIVLGSLLRACFVAKIEVRSWPLIGFLARLQNTAFVERRSIRAATQRDGLRASLEEGHSLILFPEGTSTEGHRIMPFKSSLFSAVEQPLPSGRYPVVQPVSIVATEIGGLPIGRAWRSYYSWYGDMTLVKHVWEFFKIGAFTVDVIFHPPVTIEDFGNRKLLAQYAERCVAKGVDQCVTGRFEKERVG